MCVGTGRRAGKSDVHQPESNGVCQSWLQFAPCVIRSPIQQLDEREGDKTLGIRARALLAVAESLSTSLLQMLLHFLATTGENSVSHNSEYRHPRVSLSVPLHFCSLALQRRSFSLCAHRTALVS